jgi:hypothetical protein
MEWEEDSGPLRFILRSGKRGRVGKLREGDSHATHQYRGMPLWPLFYFTNLSRRASPRIG